MTPKKMISLLLSDGYEGKCYSKELYGAFLNGFPLENLRRLLLCDNYEAVTTGAYLVYELGWLVHPLVREIEGLLDHEDSQVRFDAIYALGECTTPSDGNALGRVLLLLDDPTPFVQRGVIMFIRSSDYWQLSIAVRVAAKMRPGTAFATVIATSIRGGRIFDSAKLKVLVSHKDPVVRRFAAGMATRPRLIVDEDFLDIAAACNDEEGIHAIDWARQKALPTYATQARLYFRKEPPPPTNAQTDLAYTLLKSGKHRVEIADLLGVDRRALYYALRTRRINDKRK